MVISGQGKVSYRVSLWKNIPVKNAEEVKIITTKYPNIESDIFLNQVINNYRIKWNTTSFKKVSRIDKFSNEIIEAYFKPVKYNNRYNTISYEISFDVDVTTYLYEIEEIDVFPIKKNLLSEYELQFLKEARGISFSGIKNLKSIVNKIKSADDVAEIVTLTTMWVRENIKPYYKKGDSKNVYKTLLMADHRPYFNSDEVLKSKIGTKLGRMNVLISMLRSIEIPARTVKGLNFDYPIEIKAINSNELDMTAFSKNGEAFWIEVFLPSGGWLPVNLDGENLFHFPNKIKKRVGLDFFDLVEIDRQSEGLMEEYFFEKKNANIAFTNLNRFEIGSGFFFIPPIKVLQSSKALTKPTWLAVKKHHFYLDFVGDGEIESIKIFKNSSFLFAQKVRLEKRENLESLSLSLLKLDDLAGKMEVEIYSDDNGEIGDLIGKSQLVSLNRLDVKFKFEWLNFKLKKKIDNFKNEQKVIWLVPKIRGEAIVHWALHIDRDRGWLRDSYKINRENKLTSLLNGDFAYQLNSINY